MIGILYKSKHGSTRKIAKVINTYLGDTCLLMDYNDLDFQKLSSCDTLILGIPVYFGKLDEEMVSFIKKNQDFLIERHYSIYVTALFFSEFMSYVTRAFDYEILKDVKTMAGLGGALYYPELSISERMLLTIMNKRRPYMLKERNGEIFENFDNEEIEIFAKKIKRIDDAKA